MTITNSPRYDEAMTLANRVGTNFKTLRDNKRKLAVALVASSQVEGFALAEAITAAKAQAKWNRLATDEQNQFNVLFNAVRTIDGAWKVLPEAKQKAFLAGTLVYSTLAKEIKKAEKDALEKADEADTKAAAKAGEAESMTPEGGAEAGAVKGRGPIGDAAVMLAKLFAEGDMAALDPLDMVEVAKLFDAVEAFKTAQAAAAAKPARKSRKAA